jgi:hypothetical protein
MCARLELKVINCVVCNNKQKATSTSNFSTRTYMPRLLLKSISKNMLGYENYRPMKNSKFETLIFEGQK